MQAPIRVAWRQKPILEPDGTLQEILAVGIDISDRKTVEDELDRALDRVIEAGTRMKRDLDAAARVQKSLLPSSLPEDDRVRFAWQYHPCDELAGDSLSVQRLSPRYISVYVVDVSKHGVSAALLSVSLTRSLEPSSDASCLVVPPDGTPTNPAIVAKRLNALYPMESHGGHYFTLVYGVLDLETGHLEYITAGHPGPVLIRPGEEPRHIVTSGRPIGILPDSTFCSSVIELIPGDRLYMFSDGLSEEIDRDEVEYGIERLVESFARGKEKSLDESLESVRADLVAWHGSEDFSDDISMVCLEMKA